jgi:hypothetical protein
LAWQRLVDACQSPPALRQSAWFVIVDSDVSLAAPPVVGLADGDVPEDEGPEVEPVPLVPVLPVLPVLPLPEAGAPLEPAAPLLPLPLAPPACAAARAGAKQTIPIKTRESIFFIPDSSLRCGQGVFLCRAGGSNIRALESA